MSPVGSPPDGEVTRHTGAEEHVSSMTPTENENSNSDSDWIRYLDAKTNRYYYSNARMQTTTWKVHLPQTFLIRPGKANFLYFFNRASDVL